MAAVNEVFRENKPESRTGEFARAVARSSDRWRGNRVTFYVTLFKCYSPVQSPSAVALFSSAVECGSPSKVPKMPTTTEFLSSGTPEEFDDILAVYHDALQIKAMLKNKKQGESLESLDKWYQEELGKTVMARSPPHMIRKELVRLMDWKLSRGKFRPRLIQYSESNEESLVKSATEKGIKLAQAGKIEEAIEAVVVLKGVGPATASAVLAACVPEKCCFFADEVAHAIPSLDKLKYTNSEYILLNTELTNCAARLNNEIGKGSEKENNEDQWTPHKVELAVWTHSLLTHNKPKLLESVSNKRSGDDSEIVKKKRKRKKKEN
ncbi:uncharacterized protein LOC122255034 [Penaeus japonicus]|uniref:uncharacterized protein LOC122255034 n=1 Tax=Penaeus japonicus TaxID=27405 RepID=UPI001C70DE09|nr:uncharacterized protein LOC122255034 [Penaeus japonicus]